MSEENPTPEQTTWGVGPWQGELPTGPGSEVYDPELLANGDTRNVIDSYRYWSMAAIVADLDSKRHEFHVAIENTKNVNYFTEKIIDAFLTKTIHIYRGCPNIGEFFDINGIITFDTEIELIDILKDLIEEDYWGRKQSIETNYNLALYWKDYYNRLIKILKEIIEINNISM